MVEPSTYLIAACLPPLRDLISRVNTQWAAKGLSRVFRSERSGSHGGLRDHKSEEAVDYDSSESRTEPAEMRVSQYESNMEKGKNAPD